MKNAGREPLPDALRALALIGVLAVNAAGYAAAPWGPLLGVIEPAGSPAAWIVQGAQAALLQGKAYPMLAFLFGMSLVLAQQRARDDDRSDHRTTRRRLRALLILGVLHGGLLYFGDILTMYALCALWLVIRHLDEPWHTLRPRLRRAAVLALITVLVMIVLPWWIEVLSPGEPGRPEPSFRMISSYGGFLAENLTIYIVQNTVGLLFALPVIRLCMLAGVAAARLRLLTHPRWQAARRSLAVRWMGPLLLLNVGYAAWVVLGHGSGSSRSYWIDGLAPLCGIPLSACYIAWLSQRWVAGHRRWAGWLAPLGQRSLSLYVFHSLWCLVLFSGLGLTLAPGTVGLLLISMALWLAALLAARASTGRWLLEAWLARRSRP
ncbi:MAG: DUF418 domain-containing protein [Rubrivivax sp.]|nr:DUF418 domain-containing protein [Rubrivivax sp.]